MILVVVVVVVTVIIIGYILWSKWCWQRLMNSPLSQQEAESFQQKNKNNNKRSKVVIIGSGVSGLVSAKTFLQFGYTNVIVLEQHDDLGGVWRDNYIDAAIQGPYWLYYFSDFPWTKDLLKGMISPKQPQVQEYLRRYAEKFGVDKCIRYRHKATNIHRNDDDSTWVIQVQNQKEPIIADILIISSGNNDKGTAWVPSDVPNRDDFKGIVLHSSAVDDPKILQPANNIVVIGGSKSAYDLSLLYPEKTSLVMKTPHYFGRRWLLLLPCLDRLFYFMERNYHRERNQRTWLFRFVDYVLGVFAIKLNPPKDRTVFEDIMHGGGFHVCSTYQQELKTNKLSCIVSASVESYTRTGLKLTNGTSLPADVIIWGTGFRPAQGLKRLFAKEISSQLQDEVWWQDGLYLYKYVYHPKLPNCFFVGFKDPNFTSCMSSSAEALWAVCCAAGKVMLPPDEEIEMNLTERHKSAQINLPPSHRRAFYDYFGKSVGCDYSYALDLIKDCGLDGRVARFGCHSVKLWACMEDFAAVFSVKIPTTDNTKNGGRSSPAITGFSHRFRRQKIKEF